jgi:E3 ubiquitin-protein ligase SHPRH
MPSRFGANGLTLIEATQVIILAPFVNPAVEAQAISRVNRIGQTKPTTVHKLLIAPSIEEKLSELAAHKRARCVPSHICALLAADCASFISCMDLAKLRAAEELTLQEINWLFEDGKA